MSFTTTPHGILAKIPIVTIKGNTYADLCWLNGKTRLMLILRQRNHAAADTLPLYDVGGIHADTGNVYRMVTDAADESSSFSRASLQVEWKEVYLSYHQPSRRVESPLYMPMNHTFSPPLRIPEQLISKMSRQLRTTDIRIANEDLPWSGVPPTTIAFHGGRASSSSACAKRVHINLQFGRCTADAPAAADAAASADAPPLWASVQGSEDRIRIWDCHDCPGDHILAWPGLTKLFAPTSLHSVTLGFSRSACARPLTLTELSLQETAPASPCPAPPASLPPTQEDTVAACVSEASQSPEDATIAARSSPSDTLVASEAPSVGSPDASPCDQPSNNSASQEASTRKRCSRKRRREDSPALQRRSTRLRLSSQ